MVKRHCKCLKLINDIVWFMSCSPMASTSKSKWKCGQSPLSRSSEKAKGSAHAHKWCKASWYRKGTSGKTESEAIPRSWVSRTLGMVRWPPSHVNFKSAIIECSPPLEADTWITYTLVSCTHSVESLSEAEQLQTEMSDSESDGKEGGGISKDSPPLSPSLGRGQRNRTKNTLLECYENLSDMDTTETDGVQSKTRQTEVVPTRVIQGELGDTSGSATQLQLISKKLFSADSQQSGMAKITTAAMKKMMPPIYQTSSQGVNGTVTDKGLDSGDSDQDICEQSRITSVPTTKHPAEISGTQLKRLLVEFVAESKVRHKEVLDRLEKLEKKMNAAIKAGKKPMTSVGAEGHEGDPQIHAEDMEVTSGEDSELYLEQQFCVEFPVQTFKDFTRLEEQLEESKRKRKALVSNYRM